MVLLASACGDSSDADELAALREEVSILKEQITTTVPIEATTTKMPTTTKAPTTTRAATTTLPICEVPQMMKLSLEERGEKCGDEMGELVIDLGEKFREEFDSILSVDYGDVTSDIHGEILLLITLPLNDSVDYCNQEFGGCMYDLFNYYFYEKTRECPEDTELYKACGQFHFITLSNTIFTACFPEDILPFDFEDRWERMELSAGEVYGAPEIESWSREEAVLLVDIARELCSSHIEKSQKFAVWVINRF